MLTRSRHVDNMLTTCSRHVQEHVHEYCSSRIVALPIYQLKISNPLEQTLKKIKPTDLNYSSQLQERTRCKLINTIPRLSLTFDLQALFDFFLYFHDIAKALKLSNLFSYKPCGSQVNRYPQTLCCFPIIMQVRLSTHNTV